MGHSKLQRTILRGFRLLVFDQTVAENGTVAFGTSLTTKNFPLLTSSQSAIDRRIRAMPRGEVARMTRAIADWIDGE